MKEQYYSILEVLQKNLSYDVDEEIRKYVAHSPNTLGRVLGIDNAKSFQVLDSRVKEVYAQFGQQINALVFDIIIECKLATDCEAYHANAMLDLNLRFILDLTCPGGRVWPPRIVPAKDELHSRDGILLNKYFQPVLLTNEDLDRFAEMMLAVYCKKALRIPTVIRGTDLARWMGLKIRYVTFALEKDVKARTYFDVTREALLDQDGKEYYEAINPGTILINESRLRSEEDQNTTIIHECVHVFKDYYFFMLQRMVGAKVELYTSRRTGSPGCAPSIIDIMEEQAERLPAFIMMPAATAKAFIEDELQEMGGFLSPANMRVIVVRLSMRYGVSISMARNRMIELGYKEANGVFQYVYGAEVPSHGCTEGWAKDAVFKISMENATRLFGVYPEFAEAVMKRRVIYVDGFYVVNSSRYINKNDPSENDKEGA